MKNKPENQQPRVVLMIALASAVLVLFLLRLVYLQVIEGNHYLERADNTTSYRFNITAARGEIVDCYGRSLATNTTGYNLVMNNLMLGENDLNDTLKTLVEILQTSGDAWNDATPISSPDADGHYSFTDGDNTSDQNRLAAIKTNLGLQQYATADEVMSAIVAKYELENYEPAWQRILGGIRCQMTSEDYSNYTNFTLATGISDRTVATVKERSLSLSGAEIVETSMRSYPDGTVLPHVLGSVGKILREQWVADDYALRRKGYAMNDLIGRGGLEAVYEDRLRGQDGSLQVVKDSDGVIQSSQVVEKPQPGQTVMLTVDTDFQKEVQAALENRILTLQQTKPAHSGQEANAGAVVVLDVKTGGILATATYPTYDLNQYSATYSDLAAQNPSPLLNRAFNGLYTPGSSFKPAVAAAGLLNGVITPTSTVNCVNPYVYYDYRPTCLQHGHSGPIAVSDALKYSCNIFFYDTGVRTGLETYNAMAQRLGLAVQTGVEVGESTGWLTTPQDENFTSSLIVQAAIGQANTMVTPVQLATYAATIANKGVRYRTHMVAGFRDTNTGEILETVDPVVEDTIVDNVGAFDAIEQGMIGAAKYTSATSNYPYTIAVKTGSPQRAETYGTGGRRANYNNGVIVAYGPVEDPQIAIAAVVEWSGGGSNIAQIAVDVFNAYFFDQSNSLNSQAAGTLLP